MLKVRLERGKDSYYGNSFTDIYIYHNVKEVMEDIETFHGGDYVRVEDFKKCVEEAYLLGCVDGEEDIES